jgi:anthranilate/para-aminobenzoate synthase component II
VQNHRSTNHVASQITHYYVITISESVPRLAQTDSDSLKAVLVHPGPGEPQGVQTIVLAHY